MTCADSARRLDGPKAGSGLQRSVDCPGQSSTLRNDQSIGEAAKTMAMGGKNEHLERKSRSDL
jgi:hypothetical protein